MDAKAVIERCERAAADRGRYENLFDDAIRLTMPARARFKTANSPDDAAEDIFDETGANSVAEFVSRMQAGVAPPFTEFLRLEASSSVEPNDRDAVNRDLEEITEYAFEEIWASNFAQEISESFYDLSISTGVLNVEDRHGLVNRAIPITEALLERGPNDLVGGVFRKLNPRAEHLEALYPRAKLDDALKTASDVNSGKDKKLDVIEYTFRDWSSIHEERYRHMVVVANHREIIVDEILTGEGSNPFIAFRWSTAAGEVWGRGPLINAMAAIRTTNMMVEMVLENAAMSIVGMFQTDNAGVLETDNINLLPGTILAKDIGSEGLQPINGGTGNFNMQDMVMSDQRLNIKRALFNDMLSDPNKTPATAYEVSERMADLAYRTSSSFSRVFYECLVPYMKRTLYILEKRGDIQMPVKKGKGIKYRATSPLAMAQYGRDLQGLTQDFQLRTLMHGPMVAAASYDMQVLHPWLQKRTGVDERLYKPVNKIVESIQQVSDAMQQMQQPQGGQPNGQQP